jgi:hypothetical protein
MKTSPPYAASICLVFILALNAAIAEAPRETAPETAPPIKLLPPDPGLRLTAGADKPIFTTLDPVIVSVTLTNGAEPPRIIIETSPNQEYTWTVIRSNGASVPPTEYGKQQIENKGTIRRRLSREVAMGGQITDRFHLNRLFDMTLEGVYFVQVERMIPAADRSGFYKLKSNVFEIAVGHPRQASSSMARGAKTYPMSPLLVAATHGDLQGVELLLCHGADINAKDTDGFTVIDWLESILRRSGDAMKDMAESLKRIGFDNAAVDTLIQAAAVPGNPTDADIERFRTVLEYLKTVRARQAQ